MTRMLVVRSLAVLAAAFLPIHDALARPPVEPGCTHTDLPLKHKDWTFDVERFDSKWSHRLVVSEIVEDFLGTASFEALPSRFASIPGVVRVKQEDREVYLIHSPRLKPEHLRASLWKEFQREATAVCKAR